ncbi:MAG: 30S ribosomal protein S17 [Patescibacteria group bacterium]
MKIITGKVVSDKMQNTVVVETTRFASHPLYRKRIRKTAKFHAHNEMGAKTGDTVKIAEIRPMSKTKNWKVIEIAK